MHLLEEHLLADPLQQFRLWLEEARTAGVPQPEAMAVATATSGGAPSVRIVLLKEISRGGLVFVTSYESRKGRELEENPRAALAFHWPEVNRQVRMEGVVVRVAPEESDRLFAARARDHQLSSAASRQSQTVTLEELDRRYTELEARYLALPVPRPDFWGGYRLLPERVEFWQHRFARLNDRVEYEGETGGRWKKRRLGP